MMHIQYLLFIGFIANAHLFAMESEQQPKDVPTNTILHNQTQSRPTNSQDTQKIIRGHFPDNTPIHVVIEELEELQKINPKVAKIILKLSKL